MEIFIIQPYSFIDVITNSSSELFVCGSDKTLEFIETIISRISGCSARNLNEKELLIVKYKDKFIRGSYGKELHRYDIDKSDYEVFDKYRYEGKLSTRYGYKLECNEDTILIESNGDNTMEREDQEYLEDLGFSRYHLG